jgi:cysteine desulfurase/selenocysteine lyase
VREYDIDFLFATGHKFMSDTGIGVLYGKKEHLKLMQPALC